MLRKATTFVALTALLLTLFGCDDPKDSWYNPIPDKLYNYHLHNTFDWPRLDDKDVYIPTDENAAIALLENVPFKELSEAEFNNLVGHSSHIQKGRHALLVRGITYNLNAKFEVYEKGSALFVDNHAMGKYSRPMIRRPLVVIADTVPTEVYVTCDIVE